MQIDPWCHTRDAGSRDEGDGSGLPRDWGYGWW